MTVKEACIGIAFIASWIAAHAAFLAHIDYKPTWDYALAMFAVMVGFLLGAGAAQLMQMSIGHYRVWRRTRRDKRRWRESSDV